MLLEAQNFYKQRWVDVAMPLIFVGNGPEQTRIENASQSSGVQAVHLRDFASQKNIAAFHGLAQGLVLPSRHGKKWGLVKEAMASGLPVLVNRECACVATLVEEGDNYDVLLLKHLRVSPPVSWSLAIYRNSRERTDGTAIAGDNGELGIDAVLRGSFGSDSLRTECNKKETRLNGSSALPLLERKISYGLIWIDQITTDR
jgi:hypothetical protein